MLSHLLASVPGRRSAQRLVAALVFAYKVLRRATMQASVAHEAGVVSPQIATLFSDESIMVLWSGMLGCVLDAALPFVREHCCVAD